MLRKVLNCLPILLLTLCLLPMSVSATAASGTKKSKHTPAKRDDAKANITCTGPYTDTPGALQVFHEFTGTTTGTNDGQFALTGPTMDANCNIYGTTAGASKAGNYGTIYEITAGGAYQVLYRFTDGADGASPRSTPVLGPDGSLYGTTQNGGAGGNNSGTIWQFNLTTGILTPLVAFNKVPDGGFGRGVVFDSQGNLWGLTELYGSSFSTSTGGTLWELQNATSSSPTFVPVYDFNYNTDGSEGVEAPVMDASGNLYGAAYSNSTTGGGTYHAGEVWEWSPSSSTETVLYNFAGYPDGLSPTGGVTMDESGNLYGTTLDGGTNNVGTVWELASNDSGGYSTNDAVLYSFGTSASGDVNNPERVVLDGVGNMYGVGYGGGAYGRGGIFQLSPIPPNSGCPGGSNAGNGWCEYVLYSFTGTVATGDGWGPEGTPLLFSGVLYGTTANGGINTTTNYGTVWAFGLTQEPLTVTLSGNGTVTDSTGAINCGTACSASYNQYGVVTLTATPAGSTSSVKWSGCTATSGNTCQVSMSAAENVTATFSLATPATTVGSSVNPSAYGQFVSFTATVTGVGTTTPTGTVQFNVDGSPFGSPVTLLSGTANSASISTLTVGTHVVTAVYSGDSNYSGSTGILSGGQIVGSASAGTVATTSLSPTVYGQSVIFTATVSGEYGLVKGRRNAKGKPEDVTGSVAWTANGATIVDCESTTVTYTPGTGVGTATCATASLAVGSYTITATYSGDSNHSGSTGIVSQVVQSGSATTINVTSVSPSSEDYGLDAPVTITAVLSWTGGGAAPTASNVTIGGTGLSSYGTTSCGAPSGNTMTCTNTYTPTSADTVGSDTETATFTADGNYGGSSSPQSNNFTINTASASAVVTSSVDPSLFGQLVTFTATISGENGLVKGQRGASRRSAKPQDVSGSVAWTATDANGNTVTIAGCTSTAVTFGQSGNGDMHHCEPRSRDPYDYGDLLGRQQPQRGLVGHSEPGSGCGGGRGECSFQSKSVRL